MLELELSDDEEGPGAHEGDEEDAEHGGDESEGVHDAGDTEDTESNLTLHLHDRGFDPATSGVAERARRGKGRESRVSEGRGVAGVGRRWAGMDRGWGWEVEVVDGVVDVDTSGRRYDAS